MWVFIINIILPALCAIASAALATLNFASGEIGWGIVLIVIALLQTGLMGTALITRYFQKAIDKVNEIAEESEEK